MQQQEHRSLLNIHQQVNEEINMVSIQTTQQSSGIKKNEIMPLATTQLEVEVIIPTSVLETRNKNIIGYLL